MNICVILMQYMFNALVILKCYFGGRLVGFEIKDVVFAKDRIKGLNLGVRVK